MAKLKVGLIGAGAIAGSHITPVQQYPDAEVVAVADTSKARRDECAKTFGLDRTYAKAEDLIADPDIGAVMVALPNFLHAPVSLAALEAGKHVLLDKPFALDAKEAKQVVAMAKRKRRVFMLGMNQRYRPESQTIRALVERGEFGDIYHAQAYWLRRTGCPRFGTWFGDKKRAGGGALLDIGVHMLDLCLYLMGNWKPVAVSGAVYTNFGNRKLGEGGWGKSDRGKHVFNVDDFGTALIKFKDGATVALNASWARHAETPNENDVELFGTEAGASAWQGKVFRYGKKAGEYEVVAPQNVAVRHPHHNRHVHWLDVICRKAKADCTMEQALTVQKILDGIYASSKTGKEQRIR